MTHHFGETMAVVAAILFAWTSILFTSAGRRLGVLAVNLLRLPLGAFCLGLTHLFLFGSVWPRDLDWQAQAWLAASGIVGLAIGDSALFASFTRVGPRRGMMMMASAPVFTVITAWILLGEKLGGRTLLGIVVIIAGVLLAVSGRDEGHGIFSGLSRRQLRNGYLLGLVAAAGQGLGSTFAKLGMTELAPLSATLVRLVWGALAAIVFILPGLASRLGQQLRDRRGLLALGGAVLLGPFISVWISIVAIKHADTGVAQTLLGTVPIFVIIPAWVVYGDRPTRQSLIGVVVAVAGGALLFLD